MSGAPHGSATGGPEPCRAGDSRWLARQVDALAAAWERGECVAVEDLLASQPALDAEAAIRLIYEEVCLRRDAGQEVGTAEVVQRFPQWKEELEVLLGCDRVLRPCASNTTFPEVGTTLGPFCLRAELGRGASGRTYLATEPALADRPVVLKIIPEDQEEHLRLARLQHTHIVPLYSEQTFPDRGLRTLCMPYLGGATLAQVLDALGGIPRERRRGRHLIEVLARVQVQPSAPAPPISSGPCLRYLEGASYVEAICWIGTCLAEALHYAHTRGLFHMDITPANVLIAADGQPMLLDFHLARGPIQAGEWVLGRLGGTPGWMSPEQEAALDAVRAGRPVPEAIDGRTDIYALGLLLREALWGSGRQEPAEAGLHRRDRPPGVSVGLSDILGKCLAPEPVGRYHDAAALGDDLRRHLNDLPLRGVANRSPVERWRKWQRRLGSPVRQATQLSTLAVVIVAVALAAVLYTQRLGEVAVNLEDGRRDRIARKYPEAIRVLGRGVERAALVPGAGHVRQALATELALAQRGQDAAELHRLADLIRFRYGLAPPQQEEALMVARHCRALWDAKRLRIGPGGSRLDDETEQGIKTDMLELAIVWADLNVRLAPLAGTTGARQASLRLLDQADASFGPSPALDRERQAHAQALGRAPRPAPVTAPATPWEHYDLGRSYLRAGQIEAAAEQFRRTLQRRPQDFWPHFYQGLCAYRLGHYEDACAAFRTCIALAPEAAECHYNRALAHQALGRNEDALSDYSRALELDPGLMAAALNRGLLAYKAGRYGDAIADFLRAIHAASDRAAIGQIHYDLALAYLAAGDPHRALASGERALNLGCEAARALCDRLRRGS